MTPQPAATVEISLLDGMRFEGTGPDGQSVVVDSSPDHGGVGPALHPMELLLIGLGSCTAMDVISILRKKRQEVTAYRIEVSGVKATEPPRPYAEISIRHIIRGNGVAEEAVRHAIELSEETYCPAYAMLSKAAAISTSFEILPSAPAD
jgi:putative redox protein